MDQQLSMRMLHRLCKEGNLERLALLLETILPTLAQESSQRLLCSHGYPYCNEIPCTASILNLCNAGTSANQAEVFAYLWDQYLAPRGTRTIPWLCLKAAACQGSISLAQTFWLRDPDCFTHTEPLGIRSPPEGRFNTQFMIAVRNDKFDYIDFMIAHGADINADFSNCDLLYRVARCEADDSTTLRRFRFLMSRRVRIKDSAALATAAAGGSIELVACLLDNGADVNMSRSESMSPLMLAAAQGYEAIVRLLLERGANIDFVNGEGHDAIGLAVERGHSEVTKILEAQILSQSSLEVE